MHSVQKECTKYCPNDIQCCPQNRDLETLVSLHATRLKTDFLLTYLTEGGVMTKIHSPSGLSFLSPVKIGARQAKKCLGVSGNTKIQMRMLSHSQLFKCKRCPALSQEKTNRFIHSYNVTTKTLLATD